MFGKKKSQYKYSLAILAIVGITILVSVVFKEPLGTFVDKETIVGVLEQFGPWAPILLVLFVAIEVIVAPLPGGFLPIAGGFFFGPLLGIIYSWLGNMLGSLVAFSLARKFGLRLVKFFMPNFHDSAYRNEIEKNQTLFWISYFLPLIPVDVLSFAMGLSSISMKRFAFYTAAGFFVRMTIWSVFGNALANIFLT